MKFTEALRAEYERDGYYFPDAMELLDNPQWREDATLALDERPDLFGLDAQPPLASTPSAGIPAFLTTIIDPQILEIRQAENKASQIYDEVRKGVWTTESALFPVVENTGLTSSYGDFENSGSTSVNMNWETRQPYLFQTTIQYGDLAMDRAALGRIGLAAALRNGAAKALGKQENLIYFKGVQGLANYGIQNDPNLAPAIAPSPKANGGFAWLVNGVTPNATPNEIFADFQANVFNLISQSDGNIDTDSDMVAVMSPTRKGAITATNSFAVNTMQLIKENFPNLKLVSAIQFGVTTVQNSQGVASEMFQIIARKPGDQETGWVAFNEKLRAHRLVPDMSSFKQKMTSGAYGAIIRQPFAVSTMTGI
jgi:hypothetical protein